MATKSDEVRKCDEVRKIPTRFCFYGAKTCGFQEKEYERLKTHKCLFFKEQ
jgi:hypothetical protein